MYSASEWISLDLWRFINVLLIIIIIITSVNLVIQNLLRGTKLSVIERCLGSDRPPKVCSSCLDCFKYVNYSCE